MKTKHSNLRIISLGSGLAVALALGVWFSGAARAADDVKAMQHPMNMSHITTQAEAEALKPGDSIAMVCSKCKSVMVMPVTTEMEHVKMMTVGEKHTCDACKGSVEVVGTGKGEGKNQEVQHVCSTCGDDAMFVCATQPGSGGMKDME